MGCIEIVIIGEILDGSLNFSMNFKNVLSDFEAVIFADCEGYFFLFDN